MKLRKNFKSNNDNVNGGSNSNNNPPDNENHIRHINNPSLNKTFAKQKLIKVRLFSGAEVSCMYDHVKPTIREFNPNHMNFLVVRQLVRYQGQSLTLHCHKSQKRI